MLRSILIFLIASITSLPGFSQRLSYSIKNEVFRTVFNKNDSDLLQKVGAFNLSNSALISYTKSNLTYNLGIGISTFTYFDKLNADLLKSDPAFANITLKEKKH